MNYAESPAVFLPLLPLDDAVILPGMEITLPVTEPEEAAALAAATEGRVVVVPRIEGRFGTENHSTSRVISARTSESRSRSSGSAANSAGRL